MGSHRIVAIFSLNVSPTLSSPVSPPLTTSPSRVRRCSIPPSCNALHIRNS
jgi:hypothetical protein